MEPIAGCLYNLDEVQKITTLSKSTMYNQIEEGTFPRPVLVGKAKKAWRGADLIVWIENLPEYAG